jgi:CcmD family protein
MRTIVLTMVLLTAVLAASTAPVLALQPPAPPAQEGFIPLDQMPKQEQLPAARLVIAAYAVAWVLVFGYLWSIWSRLGRVERELADVTRRVEAGGRR